MNAIPGWVRIRSWHVVKRGGPILAFSLSAWTLFGWLTLCGRRAPGETRDTLPAGRSCESCLRALARRVDAA